MSHDARPCFNLWTEPWITLECLGGGTEWLGLCDALLRAHEFLAISDTSPLVVAGVHRLLVSIAQAICNPQRPADVQRLWQRGQFEPDPIHSFGARYAERFDLFSETTPFYQSIDLPMCATRENRSRRKSVSQLTVETSRSTALQHYRHGREHDEVFCPACAAGGLTTIPMFTTSGGRGLKPAFGGEPPIYVLPGGASLFQSLAASVLLPAYLPAGRSRTLDTPWWTHPPVVKAEEVPEVGYLHSLTFLVRRVRLIPEQWNGTCTRCGRACEWGVREMFFEPGEERSTEDKETAFWQDPFVAYRQTGDKRPTPIRAQAEKALWREFAGLIIPGIKDESGSPKASASVAIRPRVLDQVANLQLAKDATVYPVRCIGIRHRHGQPKIFEWLDVGFDVPPAILDDDDAVVHINRALVFTGRCEGCLTAVFKHTFGGNRSKGERHAQLKRQLQSGYWTTLAEPFRNYVLALSDPAPEQRRALSGRWADDVVAAGLTAFGKVAEVIGDRGADLRLCVQGVDRCAIALFARRSEFWIPKCEKKEALV